MTITIICPTLNEENYIEQTIRSFLGQKLLGIRLEILIVDGGSTDKTRAIVNRIIDSNPIIRLLDNPYRKTPFAFNIGLKEATGDFVAILGAHAAYDPNYLQTCYEELIRTGSAGCTGRIMSSAANDSSQALLVEWIMNSPFGVSPSSFRTIREGYVHSVNFAVFRKSVLVSLGGYRTDLERNQDNDMNQRLLDAGNKLFCTWKTKCRYFTPGTLKKLFQYGYKNGFWNARSIWLSPGSMRLYHFVPAVFVLAIVVLACAAAITGIVMHKPYGAIVLGAVLTLHLVLGSFFSIREMISRLDWRTAALPPLFLAFHLSYGWGTIHSLLQWSSGRH